MNSKQEFNKGDLVSIDEMMPKKKIYGVLVDSCGTSSWGVRQCKVMWQHETEAYVEDVDCLTLEAKAK